MCTFTVNYNFFSCGCKKPNEAASALAPCPWSQANGSQPCPEFQTETVVGKEFCQYLKVCWDCELAATGVGHKKQGVLAKIVKKLC